MRIERKMGEVGKKDFDTPTIARTNPWFFADKKQEEETNQFIAKMKAKCTKILSKNEGAASNDESTYLHFFWCFCSPH